MRAGLDLFGGITDQGLDFLGRFGGALRQAAHFGRHHRKAPALFTGAGRFYRRIQREDVGLKGNAFNHACDVCDLARRRFNRVHGLHDLVHHSAPLARHVGGRLRQHAGLACVVGVLFDVGGHFLHRRSRLFQRTGLGFGAARQVAVARRDLLRGAGDVLGAAAHPLHDAVQAVAHGLYVQHQAGLVTGPGLHRHGQVTLGNAARDVARIVGLATQLPQQIARDQGAHHQQRCTQRQRHGTKAHGAFPDGGVHGVDVDA